MKNIVYVEAATRHLQPIVAFGSSKADFEPAVGAALRSVSTLRSFTACLAQFLRWRHEFLEILPEEPILAAEVFGHGKARKDRVQQKTLDQGMQALEAATRTEFRRERSSVPPAESRLLPTAPQMRLILEQLPPIYRLAAMICLDSGLRAHEVVTLRPPTSRMRPSRHRVWPKNLHEDRSNTVLRVCKRKGGLKQTVAIDVELAKELDRILSTEPQKFRDRKTKRDRFYPFPTPQSLSAEFTKASRKALGFDVCFKTTRNIFVLRSLRRLLDNDVELKTALLTVSQKVGHFRIDILYEYFHGLMIQDKSHLIPKVPGWLTEVSASSSPMIWRDALRAYYIQCVGNCPDAVASKLEALDRLNQFLGSRTVDIATLNTSPEFSRDLFSYLNAEVLAGFAGAIGQGRIISSVLRHFKLAPKLEAAVTAWCANLHQSVLFSEWLRTLPKDAGKLVHEIAAEAATDGVSLGAMLSRRALPTSTATRSGAWPSLSAFKPVSRDNVWEIFDRPTTGLKAILIHDFHSSGRKDFEIYTKRMTKSRLFSTVVQPLYLLNKDAYPRIKLELRTAAHAAYMNHQKYTQILHY